MAATKRSRFLIGHKKSASAYYTRYINPFAAAARKHRWTDECANLHLITRARQPSLGILKCATLWTPNDKRIRYSYDGHNKMRCFSPFVLLSNRSESSNSLYINFILICFVHIHRRLTSTRISHVHLQKRYLCCSDDRIKLKLKRFEWLKLWQKM